MVQKLNLAPGLGVNGSEIEFGPWVGGKSMGFKTKILFILLYSTMTDWNDLMVAYSFIHMGLEFLNQAMRENEQGL